MLSLQDRKIFSGKRASEGLNCNFKSVSRDKKASWGNRFIRDHNDLIYDADPHSISNQLKTSRQHKQPPKRNQESPSPAKKYEYSPFKSRDVKTSHSQRNLRPATGLQFDNYREGVQEFEKKARVGQQTAASTAKKRQYGTDRDNAEVEGFRDYGLHDGNPRKSAHTLNPNIHELREYKVPQQINLLGLSRFEFDATISGKLLSKSNHHLDFSRNKTTKINNSNRVWYDHSKDLDKSPDLKDKDRYQSLKNIHSFRSYSAHKLFFRTKRQYDDNGCGNGGMLDKYYDIASPERHQVTHEKVPKKVDYQKMTPRPDLPKKLGTNLDYQVQEEKTLGVGNGKRAIMQLSNSQRELVFSRQVISPTRGCFR